MLLEIVGMQVDKPRQQVVACHIHGAGNTARAPLHGDDLPTTSHDGARQHDVLEHDLRIGQDQLRHPRLPSGLNVRIKSHF